MRINKKKILKSFIEDVKIKVFERDSIEVLLEEGLVKVCDHSNNGTVFFQLEDTEKVIAFLKTMQAKEEDLTLPANCTGYRRQTFNVTRTQGYFYKQFNKPIVCSGNFLSIQRLAKIISAIKYVNSHWGSNFLLKKEALLKLNIKGLNKLYEVLKQT